MNVISHRSDSRVHQKKYVFKGFFPAAPRGHLVGSGESCAYTSGRRQAHAGLATRPAIGTAHGADRPVCHGCGAVPPADAAAWPACMARVHRRRWRPLSVAHGSAHARAPVHPLLPPVLRQHGRLSHARLVRAQRVRSGRVSVAFSRHLVGEHGPLRMARPGLVAATLVANGTARHTMSANRRFRRFPHVRCAAWRVRA